MINHEERGSVRLPTDADTNQFERQIFIDRAAHEAEVASLKRKVERLRGELSCYRELYPGWVYNHDGKYLFSTGDHEPCLEGE